MSENRLSYDDLARRCAAAEQALSEMENKYRVITENSCDMITLHDVNGIYQYASPACKTLLGYEPEELVGRNPYDLFHPDDIATVQASHVAVLDGKPYTIVFRLRGKDGVYRWLETNNTFIVDDDGKLSGLICISRDIGERRQADEKLLDSEEKFRAIFENNSAAIAIIEYDTTISMVNDAYCKMGGFSREEIIGISWTLQIPPEELERLKEYNQHRKINPKDAPYEYEFSFYNRSGDIRQAVISLSVVESNKKIIAVFTDITEQKRVAEELRTNELRYRQLAQNLPDTTIFIYDHDLRFTLVEGTILPEVGFTPEQMQGKTLWEVLPPDGAEYLAQFYIAALEGKEQTNLSMENNGHYYSVSFVPIRGLQGEVVAGMAVSQDITERKRAELALEKHMLALIRPLNDTAGIAFDELFNLEEIQQLQDEFARATGVASVITHPDGTPITTPGCFTRLCKDIVRKTEKGCANCYHSDAEIGKPQAAGPKIQRCMSGGLWDAGAGITVGGRHIANWLIGQVRDEAQTEGDIRAYAREIGADEDDMVAAFYEIPSMSHEQFQQVAQALFTLANQLSAAAYQNVQQARFINERKQAEQALRESEESYRLLFNNIHDAVFLHRFTQDGELGYFIQVNDVACRRYGYTREEWLQLRPQDIDTVDGREMIPEVMHQLKRDGHATWEGAHYAKDGHVIPAEINNILLDYHGSPAILSTVRDITESKQAEEALRESEESYRALVNGLPDIVIRFDSQGRHLYVSENVSQVTHLAAPDYIGKTHAELGFPPEQSKFWEEAIQNVSNTGESFETEFTIDGPKGNIVFNWRLVPERDAEGKINTVLSISRDITDSKRSEEKLRASEERYRSIFNGITEGFALHEIVCDAAGKPCDYRFLDINPSFESLTGLQRADVVGRLQSEVVPDEDQKWVEMYGKVALTGEPCQFDNYSPVLSKHFEVFAYSPAPRQFAVLFMDITERKQAEAERDRLQAQLEQAHKMESVGRLAGGVAHDFNNMLGVIMGYTEMAMLDVDPTSKLHANLQEIQKASERSADLTRQLLAFARKQTVSPRVLDLNETVNGMLKMLLRLIGEDIDLSWMPGDDLWTVKIDPSQVDQMLANLCVNARDAIGGVGKVTIETMNTVCDEVYCAQNVGALPGEYVMFVVSDNGSGIDAETRAHLFEPFYTTKGVGAGTGLGLATAYGAVVQNGGFINVYSEPGQGTSFKIFLPRYHAKFENTSPDSVPTPIQRGKETILLVEDEPAILNLGKKVLEYHGYQVITAATPGEAISIAEGYNGEIHLLLTDVVMPEMNGRDLARHLITLYPDIKRLFMSGYTADVIAHHGVLEDGVNFLQKPFTIQDLAAKVREVLDQ